MDPELLKQRAAFQKHAARTVSVQQKPAQPSSSNSHTTYNADAAKKKKRPAPQASAPKAEFDYKTATSYASAQNFMTMARIVDYMKKRHLGNTQWGLTLQEILDEMQIFDLNKKAEAWLKEALPNNPKISFNAQEEKYTYQPPYRIKGKSSLLQVAEKHFFDGKGGILLSELDQCIANADKMLEQLKDQLIIVPTSVHKKKDKVFFYNDPSTDLNIEEDFKGLWRQISVDHLDEKKIEEYLQKHGIDVMKDLAPKKMNAGVPKRKQAKRRGNVKVQNEHLSDVLQDYD